jgi:hypothetical protein
LIRRGFTIAVVHPKGVAQIVLFPWPNNRADSRAGWRD